MPLINPTYFPWILIAATFLSLGLATGTTAGVGIFLPHMVRELGWTRATISSAIALFPLVNGILQPAMGWLVLRIHPLLVLAAGGGTIGVALLLAQFTSQPWHLLVTYALLAGTGFSASSLVVAAALINRTFTSRRGLALGVVSAGLSTGRLLLIPGSSWLILALGWRPAWAALGIMLLVGAVLCLILYAIRPGAAGTTSAGARPTAQTLLPMAWWRHGAFHRLAGAYLFCGFTVHLFSIHVPSFGLERGIPETATALALGLGSGLAALGTVVVGWMADIMPQRRLLALAYLVRGLGFAGLLVAHTPLLFMAATIITGSTFLITGNLTVGAASNVFGPTRAPMIFGFTLVGHQLAGTLSTVAGGVSFDLTGTYFWPFALAALMLVGSAALTYNMQDQVPMRDARPAAG